MRTPRGRGWPAAAAVAAMLLLAGCGDGTDAASGAAGGTGGLSGTVTVFAAASLTGSFGTLGRQFEAAHPGVTVRFNFAASSALAESITQGAPADVFASASAKTMDSVVKAGEAADPKTFARNVMEIAVPPDNPAGITSFADLAKDGVNVVVCAPEVPCGAATVKVEEASGVDILPVSEEESVTDVLAKVTSGEADAGLVYVTDVIAAGDDVKGIPFPESSEAVNTYPIVALKDAADADLAQEFVDLVLSDTGQSILTEAGFAQPNDRP